MNALSSCCVSTSRQLSSFNKFVSVVSVRKKREIGNGNESERISCKREEVWSVSAGIGVWQKKQGYHIVV